MNRDEYEDYLVDKAKELLHESGDTEHDVTEGVVQNDNDRKRRIADEEVDDVQDVETARQNIGRMRKEADVLAHRRERMDNQDLEQFLAGESEFHKYLREADKMDFADWENRILITSPHVDAEELADELDRSVSEIKLQQKVLGLDSPDSADNRI